MIEFDDEKCADKIQVHWGNKKMAMAAVWQKEKLKMTTTNNQPTIFS